MAKNRAVCTSLMGRRLLHDPSINQRIDAGWSSPVARQAHNLKVVGSNPAPATNLSPVGKRGFFVLQRHANLYSHFVRTVSVQLGNRSYAIKIAPGLLRKTGAECARLKLGARCAIITDTNAGRRFAKTVFNSLADAEFSAVLIVVPAGESAKSLKSVQ